MLHLFGQACLHNRVLKIIQVPTLTSSQGPLISAQQKCSTHIRTHRSKQALQKKNNIQRMCCR